MYAIILASVLASSVVWKIISNVFLSPLSGIPGPLLARATGVWLVLADLAGNRTSTIHRLHQTYGPVVRIGPNEVSFSDPEVVKELYGQQTAFMKAPVYEGMSVKPLGIFSLRNKADHSQRRRLLSHAFAQSNLAECEPLIQRQVQKLHRIVGDTVDQPLNMLSLFRLYAFDIVGELFLGQSFNGLDAPKIPPQFLHDMDFHFLLSGIEWNFPWLQRLLEVLPITSLQHFLGARDRIIKYGRKSYETYIDQYGRDSGRKDLLTKVLTVKDGGEVPLGDLEAYTEVANLVFAGTDTTSSTLTYLFWLLAKHPEWQERLREQVRANTKSVASPQYTELVNIPILEALMNEALRLHPAAPASLPRETPTGGRTLCGFRIPEKTIVSMQCYTTQRDPSVFDRPNEFVPERWLEPEKITSSMKLMFMPFSQGTRACLGKNLAVMELKLITAALIGSYEVKIAPSMTEDDMTMKDHFLVLPKGGKCDLVFFEAH